MSFVNHPLLEPTKGELTALEITHHIDCADAFKSAFISALIVELLVKELAERLAQNSAMSSDLLMSVSAYLKTRLRRQLHEKWPINFMVTGTCA